MKHISYKRIKVISEGKALMYLSLIPVILLIIKDIDKNNISYIVFYIILTLIPLLSGWNYLSKYLYLVEDSIIKTLKISFKLIIVQWLIIIFYISLTEDLHLKHLLSYTYSLKEFIYIVPVKGIIASISEEIFKFFIFFSILSLIKVRDFEKKVKTSVILSSIVFGLIYMARYKYSTLIPISLITIPTYMVFIKYSSITPLILNHLIGFILFHGSKIKIYDVSSNTIIYIFLSLLSASYLVTYIYKSIKSNKDTNCLK